MIDLDLISELKILQQTKNLIFVCSVLVSSFISIITYFFSFKIFFLLIIFVHDENVLVSLL